MLGRGIFESMHHGSHDSSEIELRVGHSRQRFTTPMGTGAHLAQGDSVIFAYMGLHNELVRISKIDESIPGTIVIRAGEHTSQVAESPSKNDWQIFKRGDLQEQAQWAAIIPEAWGALAIAFLGLAVWNWGWPGWIFLPLSGIWFILLFVVMSVQHNYKSTAEMELDIGYVQEVREWKQEVAEGAFVTNQTIVIAEGSPPNAPNRRIHLAYDKTYVVHEGDLAILTTDHNGRISHLRRIDFPLLPP